MSNDLTEKHIVTLIKRLYTSNSLAFQLSQDHTEYVSMHAGNSYTDYGIRRWTRDEFFGSDNENGS